ncbi:MAG TPA: hypothetical protein DDZ76_01750 [Xanthomonadales bacterium]|nr:hypothetical protein [Xanthomonadales bacterium]
MSRVASVVLAWLAAGGVWAGEHAGHAGHGEDCHGSAGVYLTAHPYIINPAVPERADTLIMAAIEAPELRSRALAKYRLEVRSATTGVLVYSESGATPVVPGQTAELGFIWDGRGRSGKPVADGEYVVELITDVHEQGQTNPVLARLAAAQAGDAGAMISDRASSDIHADGFGEPDVALDAAGVGVRASGSPVAVVVDRDGYYDSQFDTRSAASIGIQSAGSLDPDFGYRFYFGSTHAHSNWSDGGMPVSDCTSGRHGVAGGARPVDAWSYARNTAGLDFLAVVEHNHLMQEACPTCTAQGVRDRYTAGFNNAISSTVAGSFVALFGMEWGVISGGGHVNIYNQSKLMAWSSEPNHVLTPQSDYPALYTAIKNNQPSGGSFGTFNHPASTDFGSFTRTSNGDAVMRGIALVSGPAFSTSTTFTPGGTRYDARFKQALAAGWQVAPEAQQDNHCWNFGTSTPNRTVALIPNGTTFNQAALLAAINARQFYASEDRNAQLIFRTTNGTSVMGASFNTTNPSIAVTAKVLDPDGEGVQKIEIWGGVAGTSSSPGAAAAVQASITANTSLSVSLPRKTSGQRWYYYVRAVQADGAVLWSAPIWIFWQ